MEYRNPSQPESTRGRGLVYVEPLTPRERDVLALVAQAYSNQQIGELLVISEATVRAHLRTIYDKLGVCATGKSARIEAALLGEMLRYVGPELVQS